jgi:hypothetical protein
MFTAFANLQVCVGIAAREELTLGIDEGGRVLGADVFHVDRRHVTLVIRWKPGNGQR